MPRSNMPMARVRHPGEIEIGVRIVRLVSCGDVHNRLPRIPKRIEQPSCRRHRAHDEWYVPAPLRIGASTLSKSSILMDEVILHIHDDQR